jgi:tRNA nucleotidyltransferase (CCA-adding enzyme)
MGSWSHFSHDADMGIQAEGETREEVFEQMALGMTALVAELGLIEPREEVALACAAPSFELLLVDWLNALVYEMSVRKMLFSRFHVELGSGSLSGVASGEKVDPARHVPAVEVKGATYTALEFRQRSDRLWEARCVVDV